MAMEAQGIKGDISLDLLMGAFNHRIAELHQLMVARGVHVVGYAADLSALDVTVRALEQQLRSIKAHLRGDTETLFKARTLIELSSQQQKKIQQIFADFPTQLPGAEVCEQPSISTTPSVKGSNNYAFSSLGGATPATKDRKGKAPPLRCHVSAEEFSSLSSYMRGRLTLEKLNTAIDEMATFAEANARLLVSQRKKLADEMVEKVLELREIAYMDAVKGKHFFIESDMRGQILKLDNSGKAILTVLRHLGRISEVRIGRQRVFIILKV